MNIITPPDFYIIIKGKFLLLDTNFFIDALIAPTQFRAFIDEIRKHQIALVTIEPVLIEFFKGSEQRRRYKEKQLFLEQLIDRYIPINHETFQQCIELVQSYLEDGKGVTLTDFLLGSILYQYPGKVLLVTKDVADFPTNIFSRVTFFNLFHRKAIHNYGIYSTHTT